MSSLSENVQSNQVVASPHGKKSSDPEMSGFALRFNEDSDKYRITTDYNYILTQGSFFFRVMFRFLWVNQKFAR